ncbi:hypothetical protein DASC09_062170 [Saccharomycopsis crataegensis]|uniref:Uncharacterized protein n=1 Tax=Saccharomycopsis crataegensis TaxID=43959 RepID=A0AAV5QXP7_9ASCO|nr:hypothetical protein DASC09_062170 [Saccharomycopsis crataegensis]
MVSSIDVIVGNLENLSLNDSSKVSLYIDYLGELAVELRDSANRSNSLVVSNISSLLNSLNAHSSETSDETVLLNLEILRVLVNFIAENDSNRLLVAESKAFAEALEKLLAQDLFSTEYRYGQRIMILLENLTFGNDAIEEDEDSKTIAQIFNMLFENGLLTVLFKYFLRYIKDANINLASCEPDEVYEFIIDSNGLFEILNSFYACSASRFSDLNITIELDDINGLIWVLSQLVLAKDLDDEEEVDDLLTALLNLSQFLFLESDYDKLDVSTAPQEELFALLCGLETFEHELENKPEDFKNTMKQINRRVFAVIGNLSSNLNNDNRNNVDLALKEMNTNSTNGYLISSSFLILANSITNSTDRDALLLKEPHLVRKIFENIRPKNAPENYYRLMNSPQTDFNEEEKEAVTNLKKEITFFTEPLLDQSFFHLLKLLVTSSAFTLENEEIKTSFVNEFKDNFRSLVEIILINFNSVFFARVNLSLILKFLNTFIRNFPNYDDTISYEWLLENSTNIILSLCGSLKNENVPNRIKELNEGARIEIIETLQTLINNITTKNVKVDNKTFEALLDSLFLEKNDSKNQDVSMSFQNSATSSGPTISTASYLSQRFITLTILVSIGKPEIKNFLLKDHTLSEIVNLLKVSFQSVEGETSQDFFKKGLKNNLRVFTIKMNLFLKEQGVSDDIQEQFDQFLKKSNEFTD